MVTNPNRVALEERYRSRQQACVNLFFISAATTGTKTMDMRKGMNIDDEGNYRRLGALGFEQRT
ncbi:aflatoxin B1-aldehyde reductase [Sesbania bispinosa]|nr:aflatoxin B1-aldehyde reductase [Sesbania bispinosa]